jgi:hypothetical protein
MLMTTTTASIGLLLFSLLEFSKGLNSHPLSLSYALLHGRERKLQTSLFSTAIAKITASNGAPNDDFGDVNQVSISNNRIVIGAYGNDGNKGAAYVFGDPSNPQTGRSYSQLAIITAVAGASGDYFGDSVAIYGDIVVVGAAGEPSYSFKGAVYVYRILVDNNNVVTISQQAKLTANGGANGDQFGNSVAIHDKIIIVGARRVDSSKGSVYLFVNLSIDPETFPQWTQLQFLKPTDLAVNGLFGHSAAMNENIAVIGTYDYLQTGGNQAAYVFAPVKPSTLTSSWTPQMTKLTGSASSDFGFSVAVAENQIVVGAYRDDTKSTDAGAIFVYSKTSSSSSSWSQMTQLLAADGVAGDNFGRSVAISKDASTIVVGADYVDSSASITDSGAAYLFQVVATSKTTKEWTQMGKFLAIDQATDDRLGISIALESNIAVVGAAVDDSDTGSVYVVQTTPDPSPTKSMCFSPVNTVHVKDKGSIPMYELQVGDLVQTTKHLEHSYSRVLSFMHKKDDEEVEYLQIFTKHMKAPLEVSPNHLLFIQKINRNVVRAQDVQVGDLLLSGDKVTRILTVHRRGLYAPLTETGTIWVSGVTASCYVDVVSSVAPTLQAHLSHAALTPLRIMCAWQFSICETKTYSVDGFSSNLWSMAQVGLHLSTWNGLLQWLVVALCSKEQRGLDV